MEYLATPTRSKNHTSPHLCYTQTVQYHSQNRQICAADAHHTPLVCTRTLKKVRRVKAWQQRIENLFARQSY